MSDGQIHVAKMTSFVNIDSFFHMGVTILPDDYFVSQDSQCGICHEVDPVPDLSDTSIISITEHSSHVQSSATIQISSCAHVYHKNCLHTWIISTRSALRGATCPLCRTDIVERIHDPEYKRAFLGLMALLNEIESATTKAERYAAERAYLAKDDVVVKRWGYTSNAHAEAGVLIRMSITAYELEQEERRGVGVRLRHQLDRLRASLRSVFRK